MKEVIKWTEEEIRCRVKKKTEKQIWESYLDYSKNKLHNWGWDTEVY